MATHFKSSLPDTPEDRVIHGEDYGLVKLGAEFGQFIERRFREVNPDAPADAVLCGGCVVASLSTALAYLGPKTTYGPELLNEQISLDARNTSEGMHRAAARGVNVDEEVRESFAWLDLPPAERDAFLAEGLAKARQKSESLAGVDELLSLVKKLLTSSEDGTVELKKEKKRPAKSIAGVG